MDLTPPRQRRAAALAALFGNALEWYDFAVYGDVPTPLGEVFFPADRPALQTMASSGVFAGASGCHWGCWAATWPPAGVWCRPAAGAISPCCCC